MMNWEYIAGFFDGEGCISWTSQYMTPRVQITQSGESGYIVLNEIRAFLSSVGIESRVVRGNNQPPRIPNYNLIVGKRRHVESFVGNLWPHLRLKRVLAQDSARFLRLYPMESFMAARWKDAGETRRGSKKSRTNEVNE